MLACLRGLGAIALFMAAQPAWAGWVCGDESTVRLTLMDASGQPTAAMLSGAGLARGGVVTQPMVNMRCGLTDRTAAPTWYCAQVDAGDGAFAAYIEPRGQSGYYVARVLWADAAGSQSVIADNLACAAR